MLHCRYQDKTQLGEEEEGDQELKRGKMGDSCVRQIMKEKNIMFTHVPQDLFSRHMLPSDRDKLKHYSFNLTGGQSFRVLTWKQLLVFSIANFHFKVFF